MSPAPDSEGFAPYSPEFAADPWPAYAELRDRHPVCRHDELGLTLVSRYRDIRRVLTDPRFGREAPRDAPGAIELAPMPCYDRYVRTNLLETEGETHRRLRRHLSAALHPRRIRQLGGRISDLARRQVAAALDGEEVEFISRVAAPLPVMMIAELLGWPEDERDRLRPWSAAIVRLYEKDATADDAHRAELATRDFAGRLERILGERAGSPRDDFISELVETENQPGGLTRDEVVSSCMLLLNAGHEATVNAAGNGMLALLQHPDQLMRLRKSPEMIDTAIEEMLRFDPPLHLFHRYAGSHVEIAGYALREGEMVGLLYGSANRDGAVFRQPDRFEIGRHPNPHLAFGAGTHFCLGATLARLELRALFAALLEQTTTLELVEMPRYRTGLVFRGLSRLLIRAA